MKKVLYIEGSKLILDTELGRTTYSDIKAGILTGFSVGGGTKRDRVKRRSLGKW